MQKQRSVEIDHAGDDGVVRFPAAPARPDLRLAKAGDGPAPSPALQLQKDLAHAFAADHGWSVRRTVAVGLAFHVAVLGALALGASEHFLR